MADESVNTSVVQAEQSAEQTEAVAQQAEQVEQVEAAAPETEQVEEKKEQAPATEDDKKFAAKFAALTRKEKAIREREKAVEQRLKELEAKLNAQPKPESKPEVEPLDRRIRKDPFNTLKELGVDYETLTQIALNNGKLTPELQMQLMKEELEAKYSSKLEEVNKKLAEREAREEQERQAAIINNFKSQIKSTITDAAGTYELLTAEGEDGVEAVFNIIDTYYQETGEVLDVKEAVEAAEEELLEQAKKRIGLAKVKKLLEPSETKPQETKPQVQQKKTGPTLSNQSAQVQPNSGRFLSDEESKVEAAKLIRFNS